jgi:hypothetical protein
VDYVLNQAEKDRGDRARLMRFLELDLNSALALEPKAKSSAGHRLHME